MIRKFILIGTALVAALALASPAHAATTVACSPDQANESGMFPGVGQLRATGLPVKTSGYAPRCLVASFGAMMVQEGWDDNGGYPPKRVWIRGARWNAGY